LRKDSQETEVTTPPTPLPSISPETPGAPPAARKSNTLAWVLGGCGTLLVLAIIAGILGIRMFLKNNVRMGPNGEMDVRLPGGGHMRTGKPKDLGIPVYPETNSGGIGMEVSSPRQDQNVNMATYYSPDAIEKVDAWYRDNLSSDYVREGPGVKQRLPNNRRFPVPIQSNAITYVSRSGDIVKIVALTRTGTNTQIAIVISGAPATL
jgi:hypothetical protein